MRKKAPSDARLRSVCGGLFQSSSTNLGVAGVSGYPGSTRAALPPAPRPRRCCCRPWSGRRRSTAPTARPAGLRCWRPPRPPPVPRSTWTWSKLPLLLRYLICAETARELYCCILYTGRRTTDNVRWRPQKGSVVTFTYPQNKNIYETPALMIMSSRCSLHLRCSPAPDSSRFKRRVSRYISALSQRRDKILFDTR